MKIRIFYIFMIVLTNYISANDAPYFLSGGNIYPIDENGIEIEMKKEIITLDLYDDYFEVNVNFDFDNKGDTRTIIVGFPFYSTGLGSAEIYDFSSKTNGEDVIAERQSLVKSGNNDNFKELGVAYTREITFLEKSITTTEINYRSTYAGRKYVTYLFGTGKYWDDRIKTIIVNVNNHTDYWIYDMYIDGLCPERWKVAWNGDNFTLRFGWIEPEETARIKFSLENTYIYHQIRTLPGWYEHDQKLLTEEDLRYFTKDQLRIIRNTIYAYHGYIFKSQELIDYFNDEGWYTPRDDFKESDLNTYEKCNVEIIKITESER